MGAWHGESLRELKTLSKYVSVRRETTENESWKLLLAELSSVLAKGNSAILADARRKFMADTCCETNTADPGGVWPERDFI